MRQKRSPAVWARVFLTLILALVLTGLVIAIVLLRPGTSLVLPAATSLQDFSERPMVPMLFPESPPSGTCLMLLPDGDLEFVESCGCADVPRQL